MGCSPNLAQPMAAAEVEALHRRCGPAAGDGHLELYKSTMKYDGDEGRHQHGFPFHKGLPLWVVAEGDVLRYKGVRAQ